MVVRRDRSIHRLRAAGRHLAPIATEGGTHNNHNDNNNDSNNGTLVLAEVVLGDTPRQWASAGFCIGRADHACSLRTTRQRAAGHPRRGVDNIEHAVQLGNLRVLLSGNGEPGLQSLGFAGLSVAAAAAVTDRLPDGVSCHVVADSERVETTVLNHNSVQALAELVLYVDDLQGFVAALADGADIFTNKGYPPRPIKGTPFATAQYFLQPQLRCLVVGPLSSATTDHEAR